MELNINLPAYFKEHYGADDEVYRFCKKAYLFFKDREYSNILHIVGIMPVVAPQEMYDRGAWKESVRFLDNQNVASIVIGMNFEDYYHADSMGKLEQIKEMILTAVKRIKTKGKFDYVKFKEDFLSLK